MDAGGLERSLRLLYAHSLDFLIIGTQKGGTTSLHSVLKTHPDVFLHRRKELHFFDLNFERGATWYRSFFPTYRRETKHRAQHGRELVSGEASPFYLFHADVPERVAGMLPQVRLIALLRNPIDRAYSHYQHNVRNRLETLSFPEAIAREEERIGARDSVANRNQPAYMQNSYASRGFYVEQIVRWYGHFQVDQILILQSERFFAEPVDSLKEVTEFLGIAPFPRLDLSLHGLKNLGGYSSKIDPGVRSELQSLFAPYNERLYQLLGVDWRW